MNKAERLTFLCIGSSSQDVYLHNVDGLTPICLNPEDCFYNIHLGDKIYVNKVDFMTGGGASNASVTFARGGQKSLYMGLVGCDPAGSSCLAAYAAEGVDVKYVSYTKRYNTDYSTLLLSPSGERTILTYRGCGRHIKPQHFDLDKVSQPVDWIYLTSLVGHFNIYQPIIDQARKRNIKIAWNPGRADLLQADQLKQLLPFIDVLSVNKEEAQMVVPGKTLEKLLRQLRQYCSVVLITDGVNGSVAADHSEAVRAGLYHADERSIDRTGAGDSFCSGFVLKYAMGAGVRQAVHFASANSASVVKYIGAKTGILRLGEDEQLDPMTITSIDLASD